MLTIKLGCLLRKHAAIKPHNFNSPTSKKCHYKLGSLWNQGLWAPSWAHKKLDLYSTQVAQLYRGKCYRYLVCFFVSQFVTLLVDSQTRSQFRKRRASQCAIAARWWSSGGQPTALTPNNFYTKHFTQNSFKHFQPAPEPTARHHHDRLRWRSCWPN